MTIKRSPTSAKRPVFALLLACLSVTLFDSQVACAQQTATDEAVIEGEMAEDEKEKMRPTIDLGRFKIHDLRPTRNETAKLTFSLHLAFSKELNEKQVEKLEMWKHRLRDQVITAVRITYIKDFQEPDLALLRRKILIRINRLFDRRVAEEVLLTEYLFRTS